MIQTEQELYTEGFKDWMNTGAANLRTAAKGIDDNELNSLYSIVKMFNDPQTLESQAKTAVDAGDNTPTSQSAPQPVQQLAPTEAPPEISAEQAMSAEEIATEAEADPTPETPEEAALPPEEKKKQDAAKGGHVAQILKKVGLAKTPTSRVLSQALMALDIEDLIAVKNAAVEQADRLAKRQTKLQQSFSAVEGMRIIEHALFLLERGRI